MLQEIILPSLVGALLVISWYWLMDLLPQFRAARRTTAVVTQTTVKTPAPDAPPAAPAPSVPAPVVDAPAAEPVARHREAGAGIGQMIGYVVIAAAVAKRQQAWRIAVLQSGTARADVPALQAAVGASHQVILVSVDEAVRTRYDLLLHLGDQPGTIPASILKLYDMNFKLEEPSENLRVAMGTPKA